MELEKYRPVMYITQKELSTHCSAVTFTEIEAASGRIWEALMKMYLVPLCFATELSKFTSAL